MQNTTIRFTIPDKANIDMEKYLDSIKQLIIKERESDPTVVLHSDQEIISKYHSSIVWLIDSDIIANSSIYPTNMKPLNNLILWWQKIKVWESWSVIIHPDFRWRWFWKKITTISLQTFSPKYDIIVWATVNAIMYNLRLSQWFEAIPFPQELYEEWKKFLSPLMHWWVQEFQERAKCMMLNISLSNIQKQELISLLQSQNIIP